MSEIKNYYYYYYVYIYIYIYIYNGFIHAELFHNCSLLILFMICQTKSVNFRRSNTCRINIKLLCIAYLLLHNCYLFFSPPFFSISFVLFLDSYKPDQ